MNLPEAFRAQAQSCEALGSPFMARLMNLMADRLTPGHGLVAARLFGWAGDPSSRKDSLPLRLAGGLHTLRLNGEAGLAAVYPPNDATDDALWDAVSAAMRDEATFLLHWIERAPQTNEVRRAATFRAAGQWLTARYGLPLELRELGAAAGLNLWWDRFALRIGDRHFGPEAPALTLSPDWDGVLLPDAEPVIADRRGVDLAPLSPRADALHLRAYLWPDQRDRLARTDRALSLPPAPVDRADAADWLEGMDPPSTDQVRFICHSVAWQYFPETVQARATAAIEAIGRLATARAPVAWFSMEAEDDGPGAVLRLRLWPGDTIHHAGRADFHGRWVQWRLA